MIEQWFTLILEPGPRGALVLDVSEGARKAWPYVRNLVTGALAAMPTARQPQIFFLGNPSAFPARDFAGHAEGWFQANVGRARIIGPVFEQLARDASTAVAVVGAGRIFDLDDWRGHSLAEHAAWCQIGPIGMTNGVYGEESFTCEQLADRLSNPAICVEVVGQGVIPFFWDHPAFRYGGGKLIGLGTDGQVRIGMLAPAPERVCARVIQTNGARRDLTMLPAEPAPSSAWVKVPTAEFNLLRQCLRLGHFHCPACNETHTAGRYSCPQSNGRPIFPLLAKLAPGGFGVLDTGAWDARIRPHPCPALLLDAHTVAMRTPNGGVLFRFDAGNEQWRPAEQFPFSRELEKNLHALVL